MVPSQKVADGPSGGRSDSDSYSPMAISIAKKNAVTVSGTVSCSMFVFP